MAFRHKFVARTRKRNEIDFYNASWYETKTPGLYEVEFLEGPYKGEKYQAVDVAKAREQNQVILRKRYDNGRDY